MRKNIGIEEGYWKKIGLLKEIKNKKINNNGKNFEITEESFKFGQEKFKLRRKQIQIETKKIQIKTKMKSRKKPFFEKKKYCVFSGAQKDDIVFFLFL